MSPLSIHLRPCVLATAAFLMCASAALGANYSASTPHGGSFSNSIGVTSTGAVGLINLPNDALGSISEQATASQGGLMASSQITIDAPNLAGLGGAFLIASALASGSWGDLVISGPPGQVVVAGLNLVLNGTFATGAMQSNNWGGLNVTGITVSVSGNAPGLGFAGGYEQSKDGATGMVSASSTGILSTPGAIPVNVTSPTFTVMANVPFGVSLDLATRATGEYRVDGSGGSGPWTLNIFSVANFNHTLTFATAGPVFNLPAGYDVTSVEAGITNNRFAAITGVALHENGRSLLTARPSVTASSSYLSFGRRMTSAGQLKVLDVSGRIMRSLGISEGSEGVNWDGKDESGRMVRAGIYLVRLTTVGIDELVRIAVVP